MKFVAIIEQTDDWFIASCSEVSGANGQGKSFDEAVGSLRDAIELILEDHREDGTGGVLALLPKG